MIIKGKWLRALLHACAVVESSPSDGDNTDEDIELAEGLAKMFRRTKRNAVLVLMTPREARALIKATDNSLCDADYRKDHMSARERKFADGLAARLDEVSRGR